MYVLLEFFRPSGILLLGFDLKQISGGRVHLRISATHVKLWFQYKCERQFVFRAMPQEERAAIPIEEAPKQESPWAAQGDAYERKVVSDLKKSSDSTVVIPKGQAWTISEKRSLDFCKGNLKQNFAHQLLLKETPALRRLLAAPEGVEFGDGHVDLVESRMVEGRRVLRLIDIKATPVAALFHKAQVAWYALMLRGVLEQHGIDADIDPIGEIWHRSTADREVVKTPFALRSYEGVVVDWARRRLRSFAAKKVFRDPTTSEFHDTTSAHLYFKCEQCKYLPHCIKSISGAEPASWDVSAVPGLTQSSKAQLLLCDIDDVGKLAKSDLSQFQTWSLQRQGREIVLRANALLHSRVERLPNRVSLRMPPATHVGIYLSVDRDPMEGRLAALGCLVDDGGDLNYAQGTATSLDEERTLLRRVLGLALGALTTADTRNSNPNEANPSIVHIYVYEPAEAADLADALGRHLAHDEFRVSMLELIRLFPPDSVFPEPEYKGFHQLPACSLRSVVQEIYVVPAKVSLDLARVSIAPRCRKVSYQALYVIKLVLRCTA